MSRINVGARSIPIDQAQEWLGAYFDEPTNRTVRKPYAYPAYDSFNAGSGVNELNDGDLLAPGMLNAAPTIAAFYSLQRVRRPLEQGLAAIDPTLTLAQSVADDSVDTLLGGLVDVLDSKPRPYGVRLTTLLKVLHRKRPLFVPLYDQFVRTCYVGAEAGKFPVPYRRKVATSVFCVDIAKAINNDITTQEGAFAALRTNLTATVPALRIIDVLAWNEGRGGSHDGPNSGKARLSQADEARQNAR